MIQQNNILIQNIVSAIILQQNPNTLVDLHNAVVTDTVAFITKEKNTVLVPVENIDEWEASSGIEFIKRDDVSSAHFHFVMDDIQSEERYDSEREALIAAYQIHSLEV